VFDDRAGWGEDGGKETRRKPMKDETFEYEGYCIPVRLMLLTGGGPDSFDDISKVHISILREHVGLRGDMNIVEIGCGIGRDAIPLTRILFPTSTYMGIDIIKEQIEWDSKNISPRYPNFSFYHFDIKEQWYNPDGKLSLSQCQIPAGDGTIDLVILQSVFTHMLRTNIIYYLGEFRRILSPMGRVYATFFIVDDDILAAQNEESYINFVSDLGDGCYIRDIENPTQTVGYRYSAIQAMMRTAGLQAVSPPLLGSWSGRQPSQVRGQDGVIMIGLDKIDCDPEI
jgi:ubiquinone/menaquinone biosynthesis C-methylase UbiE